MPSMQRADNVTHAFRRIIRPCSRSYAMIGSGSGTVTTYPDRTVQAGQTYYYVVTAVDGSGAESVYSNQIQVVIPTP